MASPEVIAFHSGGMAIDRRRVLNKISYDAGKGARREDPMFKGLTPNSSGSRNAPFLVHTNQAALPFEPPVALAMLGHEGMSGAGNRGALWNPAGRRYAKAVLDRRAMDLLAQQEMMPEQEELAPPSAAKETAKAEGLEAEIDTLRASLLALAQTANRSVQKGTAASDELKSLSSVQQSLVKLGPDMSMEDLTDVLELVNDLQYAYQESEGDGEEFLEGDDALETEYNRRRVFVTARLEIIGRIKKYLQSMVDGLKRGLSDKERKQLSRSAKASSGIGKLSASVGEFKKEREGRRTRLIDAGFDIPAPGTGRAPTVVPKPTAQQKRELKREERPITEADIRRRAASETLGRELRKELGKRATTRANAAQARRANAAQPMEEAQAEVASRRSNISRAINTARQRSEMRQMIDADARDDAEAEAIRQAASRGTAAQASLIARMGLEDSMMPGVPTVRNARRVVRERQDQDRAAVGRQALRQKLEELSESAPIRRAATEAAVVDRASAEYRAAATARRQNKRRAAIERAML